MIKEKIQDFITDLQVCIATEQSTTDIHRKLDYFSENRALFLPDPQHKMLKKAIDILFFANGDTSEINKSVKLLKQLRDEIPY